jgi:hypothetical protein
MTEQRPISLRDLAFVRDVLIPRAWVSGDEVDELVRLRARLDRYFEALRQPPPPPMPPTTPTPPTTPPSPAPVSEPPAPIAPDVAAVVEPAPTP